MHRPMLLDAPARRVTMRWPRAKEFVHVFCYISLSIFFATTSACNAKRTRCRHESAALAPWSIDVERIHYKNTSLALGDAAHGSISEGSKDVG